MRLQKTVTSKAVLMSGSRVLKLCFWLHTNRANSPKKFFGFRARGVVARAERLLLCISRQVNDKLGPWSLCTGVCIAGVHSCLRQWTDILTTKATVSKVSLVLSGRSVTENEGTLAACILSSADQGAADCA